MFKYKLGIFMQKFKRGILPVKFKPYFTSMNTIPNYSTIFSETNNYFPSVISIYGFKSLSGLRCKVREEIPKKLNEQNYLRAFQSELKIVYFKINQIKVKFNFRFRY